MEEKEPVKGPEREEGARRSPGASLLPRVLPSSEVIETLRSSARAEYPDEACGALLGRLAKGEEPRDRVVVRGIPLENVQTRNRERRYRIEAPTVRRLEAEARKEGLELLGFYHSHPDHPAVPSETDRIQAWPWYTYLIVPVEEAAPGRIRAWRLADDRSAFHELPVKAPSGKGGSGESVGADAPGDHHGPPSGTRRNVHPSETGTR